MGNLLYFLSTSEIPACENPTLLQVILFGKLIFDIVKVLLPIGLILFVMIDLTKCVLTGDASEQSRKSRLAIKRVVYAVTLFAVPYFVTVLATILQNLMPDYSSCLSNATEENISIYEEKYNAALDKEKEEREDARKQELESKISTAINNITPGNTDYNLRQGDSRWNTLNVCGGHGVYNIGTSGCGYTAYTVIVRLLGYDVYPPDIVDIACNEFGYKDTAASVDFLISKILNDRFNLKAELIVGDGIVSDPDYGKKHLSKIKQALLDGKYLIVQMPGHYISILGINSDGTIIVGDSSRDRESTNKYTLETLYEETKDDHNDCREKKYPDCGWAYVIAYSKK